MGFLSPKSLLLYLLSLHVILRCESSKLNVPRVLLPVFQSFSTYFTLDVTGAGCYKWSVSRLDIIQLIPVDLDPHLGCSRSAIVSTVTKDSSRHMAIVLAQEYSTGFTIRADVITDVIRSLRVVTTTRELYMEEPPEAFEVRAYDDQGNEFTTLEGIEFHWSVNNDHAENGNVLRFMSFRESPYETPSSVEKFDHTGKQGHIVLLEGIRTGSAKVSVRLSHPEYKQVPNEEVSLRVVANLIIEPNDAYIMLGDVVDFKLSQVRQGALVELDLTDTQYTLHPMEAQVADVEHFSVTGKAYGKVKLVLLDRHASDEDYNKLPSATVTVARPVYIDLAILPFHHWSIVVEQEATILAELFDKDNHKFHLGTNSRIEMKVDEALFLPAIKPRNGSFILGSGRSVGSTMVSAFLDSLPFGKEMAKLSAEAKLSVFPKLQLRPSVAYLLFDPFIKPRSHFDFNVLGGDGNYVWSTKNTSVIHMTPGGTAIAAGLGETRVSVMMNRNPFTLTWADVFVSPAVELKIVSNEHEAEVGKPIYLQVALFGDFLRGNTIVREAFTSCKDLPLVVTLQEGFYHDETLYTSKGKGGCATIGIIGSQPGESQVVISYSGSKTLQAEASVSAFNPIRTIQPVDNKKVVLAVGSSRHVVFNGGPQPLYGQTKTTVAADNSVVQYKKMVENDEFYVYEVLCLELGETVLTIHVTKFPNQGDKTGIRATGKVSVLCTSPKYISFQSRMYASCPEYRGDKAIMLVNSDLRLNFTIQDENGNIFDNATSVLAKWKLSTSLHVGTIIETFKLDSEVKLHYTIPLQHYKHFHSRSLPGPTTGTFYILGYPVKQHTVMYDEPIESSFSIEVVEKASVAESEISIFYYPKNRMTVDVLHGSGNFKVSVGPSYSVIASYNKEKQSVDLVPKESGSSILTVEDNCLRTTFQVDLKVVRVASIGLKAPTLLEKGRAAIVSVQVFDKDSKPVPLPSVDGVNMINLELQSSLDSILEIERIPLTKGDVSSGIVRFKITGLNLGETTLVASWSEVPSSSASVQVFAPIRLQPRNLTMIVGVEFQISYTGGPPQDLGLVFSTDDNHIATHTNLMVKAHHVGRTILTVSSSSYPTQISKDSIEIQVVAFNGVRIQAPVTQLCVGCLMPVVSFGTPKTISPLILGSINPALSFKWSTSHPGIIQLRDPFHGSGIEVDNDNRIAVRARGIKPGKTSILLTVIPRGVDKSISFNSSLEVEVTMPLKWVNPPVTGIPRILLAPNIELDLKTNKDIGGFVNYKLHNFYSSIDENDRNGKAPSISPTGILSVGSLYGGSLVVAQTSDELANVHLIALYFEVRPVHYMMINVVNELELRKSLHSMPKGLILHLNVTYHDNFGFPFYSAPSYINFKTSRSDKVQISHGTTNNTLFVDLDNNGSILLQLFSKTYHYCDDYLRIPIESVISPHRLEVTTGDIVCFSSPFKHSDEVWASDNDVLEITNSGIGRAKRPGTAVITLSVAKPSSPIITSTTIEVSPLVSITLEPYEVIITNSEAGETTFIPVLLNQKGKRDVAKKRFSCPDSMALPISYPFQCEMRFNKAGIWSNVESIFQVTPSFIPSVGLYACKITTLHGPTSNTSLINSNMTLRVTGMAHGDVPISDSLYIVFYPSVSYHPRILQYSSASEKMVLYLLGVKSVLSQVSIEPSHNNVFKILSYSLQAESSIQYEVTLAPSYALNPSQMKDLSLYIVSPLSQQRIKVPVVLKSLGEDDYTKMIVPQKPWGIFFLDLFTLNGPLTLMFLAFLASAVFTMNCYFFKPDLTSSKDRFVNISASSLQHSSSPVVPELPSPIFSDTSVYGSHIYRRPRKLNQSSS